MDTIYIEESVRNHPRTLAILERHPKSTIIDCQRYTEVFNPRSQNFRLQKKRPALILAEKHGSTVIKSPSGYSIGTDRNYYFSHMLNCLYDCRYCFLQGMYQSANYVHFVNFETFEKGIDEVLKNETERPVSFFSGYDCDSLALESLTAFAAHFIPFFRNRPGAELELRTKSINTSVLEDIEPVPNVIVAFTMTPDVIAREIEHGAPSFAKRLNRVESLSKQGWVVGLRLDPLIPWPGFERLYSEMLNEIFSRVKVEMIHSVTLGPMRFPKEMYDRIVKLYPADPLFAQSPMETRNGQVSYAPNVEEEMTALVSDRLRKDMPADRIFHQN